MEFIALAYFVDFVDGFVVVNFERVHSERSNRKNVRKVALFV